MGAADDTQVEKANWHWRNSMRPARFFNLDARAALPFLLLLVYFRPISLLITLIVTMAFKYLGSWAAGGPAGWNSAIARRSITDKISVSAQEPLTKISQKPADSFR